MILEFSGPCLENLFTARPYSLIGRSIISVRSRSLQNQINKGYRVRALLGARRRKSRGSTWSPQKKKQGLYLEPAEEKLRVRLGAREREAPLTETVVRQGILALEDGRIFRGRAAGATTRRGGEVVFNTSLTGYQEVFTDPSYSGQIVCLTYPHIGNVGTNLDDEESPIPHIESLVVREFSAVSSNWRSAESAQAYLTRHNIPVVWDVDTRSLVRHIRKMGALRGVVATDGTPAEHLIAEARALPSMAGLELASRV